MALKLNLLHSFFFISILTFQLWKFIIFGGLIIIYCFFFCLKTIFNCIEKLSLINPCVVIWIYILKYHFVFEIKCSHRLEKEIINTLWLNSKPLKSTEHQPRSHEAAMCIAHCAILVVFHHISKKKNRTCLKKLFFIAHLPTRFIHKHDAFISMFHNNLRLDTLHFFDGFNTYTHTNDVS